MALSVVFTIVMKKGLFKWAWIPGLPLLWDLLVTMSASYQKIFDPRPTIGYWANHQRFVDARAEGRLLAPATTPTQMDDIIRNTFIQGTLSIIYAVLVLIVVAAALWVSIKAVRSGGLPTSEPERVPSRIFAPRSFVLTRAEKEVLAEWQAAGLDPTPIRGHH